MAAEVGLEVWAALASLVTLMLGWLWHKIEANDERIEENRAANDKLKARLYGASNRSDDGDVNQLQLRVHDVEETQKEIVENVSKKVDRMSRDLHGAEGDDSRDGLVNDMNEMKEIVGHIDEVLEEDLKN